MKIVFDTNVLLAGIFARGLCDSLLKLCIGSPDHSIFVSQAILDEFVEKSSQKFRAPAVDVRNALTLFGKHMILVEPTPVPAEACRDPEDLVILGTLVAADADCLVTGDQDLLVIKQFSGRRILSPRQCFELLTRHPESPLPPL